MMGLIQWPMQAMFDRFTPVDTHTYIMTRFLVAQEQRNLRFHGWNLELHYFLKIL
jgi:hypothetical protein